MHALTFWSFVLTLFLSLAALARQTKDLLGIWIIEPRSPPGVVLLNTLTITESSHGLRALYKEDGGERPITESYALTEATVSDDTVFFGSGTWHMKGRFEGRDKLLLTSFDRAEDNHVAFPGSYVFRRSSSDDLTRRRAALPHNLIFRKLPLPALRDLPSNGLAPTPPMGWASWNAFMQSVDDTVVRQTADALVSSGLRDSGYTLVEVDDGWQGVRDEQGTLHPNEKFHDMKALADYVHSRGLKFGLYTAAGPYSCAGYVGSHGYEGNDARTFAEWGVDFVMYDACSAIAIYYTEPELQALHQKMSQALRSTGRPIVYKVHDKYNVLERYGQEDSWGRKIGANVWRTGADLVQGERWPAVSSRFERHGRPEDTGPGGWNDADNLVIDVPGPAPDETGLTFSEARTHFTLWSMLASPLILGNDLRNMSAEVRAMLSNDEVIAVDQDPLGKQGGRAICVGSSEVWTKPLADGSLAVALFNRANQAATISVRWADLSPAGQLRIRDLWEKKTDLGDHQSDYSALVPAHGSVLLRVWDAQETNLSH